MPRTVTRPGREAGGVQGLGAVGADGGGYANRRLCGRTVSLGVLNGGKINYSVTPSPRSVDGDDLGLVYSEDE
jgi:hypothetical protein